MITAILLLIVSMSLLLGGMVSSFLLKTMISNGSYSAAMVITGSSVQWNTLADKLWSYKVSFYIAAVITFILGIHAGSTWVNILP